MHPGYRFRANVTEEEAWQKVVYSNLKNSLEVHVPTDSFFCGAP